MEKEKVLTALITQALASPEGHLRLATAEEFIIGELERNRFNTERAVEVYSVAISDSMWAEVKDMPSGSLIYRDFLLSGLKKSSQPNSLRDLKKALLNNLLWTNGRLGDFCAPC